MATNQAQIASAAAPGIQLQLTSLEPGHPGKVLEVSRKAASRCGLISDILELFEGDIVGSVVTLSIDVSQEAPQKTVDRLEYIEKVASDNKDAVKEDAAKKDAEGCR